MMKRKGAVFYSSLRGVYYSKVKYRYEFSGHGWKFHRKKFHITFHCIASHFISSIYYCIYNAHTTASYLETLTHKYLLPTAMWHIRWATHIRGNIGPNPKTSSFPMVASIKKIGKRLKSRGLTEVYAYAFMVSSLQHRNVLQT